MHIIERQISSRRAKLAVNLETVSLIEPREGFDKSRPFQSLIFGRPHDHAYLFQSKFMSFSKSLAACAEVVECRAKILCDNFLMLKRQKYTIQQIE